MDQNLESAIESLKRRYAPDCPPGIEQNVIRRIRLAKSSQPREDLVAFLFRNILRPRVAVAGIVLVSALSSAVAAVSTANVRAAHDPRNAARAFGFDVITNPHVVDLE